MDINKKILSVFGRFIWELNPSILRTKVTNSGQLMTKVTNLFLLETKVTLSLSNAKMAIYSIVIVR